MRGYNTLCWTCVHTNELACSRFDSPMQTPKYAKLSDSGDVISCSRYERVPKQSRFVKLTERLIAEKYGVSVRTVNRSINQLLYCECANGMVVEYSKRIYRINGVGDLVSEGEGGTVRHGVFKNNKYFKQLLSAE